MPRNPSYDEIYQNFMQTYCKGDTECELGITNYHKWLNSRKLDDTKSFPKGSAKPSISELLNVSIGESFSWLAPIMKQIPTESLPKNLIKAVALNVGSTGQGMTPILPGWEDRLVGRVGHEVRHWDADELRYSARTISRGFITIDHGATLWHDEVNVGETLFGDFEDNRVETVGWLYFDDLWEMVGREIQYVSVDSWVFNRQPVNGLLMRGVYFTGLSLMLNEHPGDVNARVQQFVPTPVLESFLVTSVSPSGSGCNKNKVSEVEKKPGVSASVDEQLRDKYGIIAEKSKKSQFLYAPTDTFSDWKFPVRDNEGNVQKELVEAALKRFHQTEPEVQKAIKGSLCSLAKEVGIDDSEVCGTTEEPITEVRVAELITAAITDLDKRIFEKLAERETERVTALRKQITEELGKTAKATESLGSDNLLVAPPASGVMSFSDEEKQAIVHYAIHNTPLKEIRRIKSGR